MVCGKLAAMPSRRQVNSPNDQLAHANANTPTVEVSNDTSGIIVTFIFTGWAKN